MKPSVRFEVFKRDAFTCQYCGNKAPDVVLECDHIKPLAAGGDDSLLNLITSCFSCNRGKGKRQLSDTSVADKAHVQAALFQERRNQLAMIAEWHLELQDLAERQVDMVAAAWKKGLRDQYSLTEDGRLSAKRLINQFGVAEVLASMDIAIAHYAVPIKGRGFSHSSIDEAWEKIGGIAYNRKNNQGFN